MKKRFKQILPLMLILAMVFTMASVNTAYAAAGDPPVIVSITPTDGATGVSANTTIVVTFDQAMQRTGSGGYSLGFIGESSFAFGSNSWSSDGTTVTLTPTSRLAYSTTYTMTIGFFWDASGTKYSGTRTITFTTEADTYPPSVTGTNPANSAASATIAGPVSVSFSEAMNPSAGTLTIAETGVPANTVSGSTAWSNGNTTVTFTHSIAFESGKSYTVTLTGFQDGYGNAMPEYTFSFTTYTENTPPQLSSHTPAAGAADVVLNTGITLNFNERMNTLAGDITVTDASSNPVSVSAAAWSNGNKTATYTPTGSLAYGTVYTVTLSGFKDESNNDLGAVDFTFTTKVQEKTPMPSFTFPTYAFQLATDTTALFTLNARVPSDTTYKVYASNEAAVPIDTGIVFPGRFLGVGGIEVTDVTLNFTSAANRPAVSTDYYISATEPGKAESPRVKVTIIVPTPIAGTSPANGATDVAKDAAIVLDFGKPMQQFGSISVVDAATSTSVNGTGTWSADYERLTFQPSAELAPGTQYTVTFPTFWDIYGFPVLPGSFSFTTAKDELTPDYLMYYTSIHATYNGSPQPFSVIKNPLYSGNLGAITVKYDGSTTPPVNAGIYAITVDVTESAEFSAISNLPLGNYTIDPLNVTITGVTAFDREFAAGNTSVELSFSGASVNGRVGSDDVAPAGGVGTMADDAVGTNKPITVTGVTLTGADAGNYNLTAQPTGITVNILAPPNITVISVTVKTAPTKTTYTVGDSLDLTGLVVTLHKSDSSTEDVAFADFATKGITTNPSNGTVLSTSNTAVTITYTADGKSISQSVTVNPAPVIDATISPTSVSYDLNDPGDVSTWITWNSARTVTDVVYGLDHLTIPDAVYVVDPYTVTGSELTIKSSYLGAQGFSEGTMAEFTISFDKGDSATLTVNIVDSSTTPDSHSITVETDGHGTANPSTTLASAGTEITLTITPNSGYHFKEWQVISPVSLSITGNSFTMPDEAVIVKATFEADATNSCTVTFINDGSAYAVRTVQAGESIGRADWPANPAKSGYTFSGWYTGENGSGMKFKSGTAVTATMTVYAKWTLDTDGSTGGGSSSGSGTSSMPAPAYNAVVSGLDNTRSYLPVTVNTGINNAAVNVGAQQGNIITGGGTMAITVPSIPGVNSYTLGIPAGYLSTPGGKGTLTFNSDAGSMTLPSNMLAGMAGAAEKKAEITIGRGEKSSLSEAAKAAIGDRPLIQLTMTIDEKQTEWNNSDAPVTISIPYTPTAAELTNPESIIIWYIDGSGKTVSVPNGHYDSAAGTVTFTTTHFSYYAVGYNVVSFKDAAASAWYSNAVGYIAARGITTGTGNGNYSPEAKLTRGEFLVMLMKAYGIEPDTNLTNNFADAGNMYYRSYLAAAKRLGISGGIGNNMFAPGKEITRQEMFTLLYNALKVIGKLPQGIAGKPLSSFSDAGELASWAKDAMTLMAETGTISGSGGKLLPASSTTRAEMAQVLYNLLSK